MRHRSPLAQAILRAGFARGARVAIITVVRLTGDTEGKDAEVSLGTHLTVIARLVLKGEGLAEAVIAAVDGAIIAVITRVDGARDAVPALA